MYQGFGFCFIFVCGFLFLPRQFSNLSVKFYNHIYKHRLYWGDSFNAAGGKGWKTITSNPKEQGAVPGREVPSGMEMCGWKLGSASPHDLRRRTILSVIMTQTHSDQYGSSPLCRLLACLKEVSALNLRRTLGRQETQLECWVVVFSWTCQPPFSFAIESLSSLTLSLVCAVPVLNNSQG